MPTPLHSGLLPTSRGSLPVSLPGLSQAQVTGGGVTSVPRIHQACEEQRERAKGAKFGRLLLRMSPTARSYAGAHEKFGAISFFLGFLFPFTEV